MGRKRIEGEAKQLRTKFNLSLEPGYSDTVERLSKETGLSQTKIIHNGIDQLVSPRAHYAKQLGLEDIVHNPIAMPFTTFLRTSLSVRVYAKDLGVFFALNGHLYDVISRVKDPAFTTKIMFHMVSMPSDPSGPIIQPSDLPSISALRSLCETEKGDDKGIIAISGIAFKELPDFMFISDDTAVISEPSYSYPDRDTKTSNLAMIWKDVDTTRANTFSYYQRYFDDAFSQGQTHINLAPY